MCLPLKSLVHKFYLSTFAANCKTKKMKKSLLIAMLLCVTIAGFAKREKIDLNDQRRSLMPSIEAYIDGQVLEFGISDELGILDVIIEDVSGNVVYRSTIDGNKGMIPLDLDLKEGEYVLIINSMIDEIDIYHAYYHCLYLLIFNQ